MRPIFGAAAAAALALAPLAGLAQQSEDETTERLNAQQLPTEQASDAPDGEVASVSQTGGELPALGGVPAGAVVAGGVVIIGGVAIVAAAGDDDNTNNTVSTTN
ncbi:MAG: hypothetical protein AAGI51_08475 [Pseudomonadota bacterium]